MAASILEDVFVEIVSHLDDPTDCAACRRVCKAWNQFSETEAFHKRLYDVYWKLGEESDKLEISYRTKVDELKQKIEILKDPAASLVEQWSIDLPEAEISQKHRIVRYRDRIFIFNWNLQSMQFRIHVHDASTGQRETQREVTSDLKGFVGIEEHVPAIVVFQDTKVWMYNLETTETRLIDLARYGSTLKLRLISFDQLLVLGNRSGSSSLLISVDARKGKVNWSHQLAPEIGIYSLSIPSTQSTRYCIIEGMEQGRAFLECRRLSDGEITQRSFWEPTDRVLRVQWMNDRVATFHASPSFGSKDMYRVIFAADIAQEIQLPQHPTTKIDVSGQQYGLALPAGPFLFMPLLNSGGPHVYKLRKTALREFAWSALRTDSAIGTQDPSAEVSLVDEDFSLLVRAGKTLRKFCWSAT
eukprot:TRINITY_DN6392_c0_g1_i1.p1 TRINITY_DN6392_c0_g1~~TRINITY_DN6392_c0_g1_i1.p1  ORF type:complete len:414 (-),score=53.84 TRINITY_DN6392_c0_g1_i1:22-1263(-)